MSKISILLLISLVLTSCGSNDFNQYMPDQDKDQKFIKEQTEDFTTQSEFLPNKLEDNHLAESYEEDKIQHPVVGQVPDQKIKPSLKDANQLPLGTFEKSDKVLVHDNAETLYKLRNAANSSFGIIYFKDDYSYVDPTSNFVRTYENSTGSIKGGILQLQMERYFSRRFVDLSWGINLGIGYNNGRGIFLDGSNSESETKFTLWTLPLDFSLAMDIPLTTWIKISAYGGPSAMGLIQNRDDRDQADPTKQRRQVSYGYFYGAKFRFSLNNVFKSSAIKMYDLLDVTQFYLTLDGRIQQYNNFQDELSISGTSIGIGFTFEYL